MAERYERARAMFEHGEYQRAADELAVLVDDSALAPPLHGTTELRMLLGRAYFHSAQLSRAETVVRAVLADHPDEPYANLLLGRTLQRQGRRGEATPHLAMAELLGGYVRMRAPAGLPVRQPPRVPASSARRWALAAGPPAYPPIPPDAGSTRWQGSTMHRGLAPRAVPTARAAPGCSTARASAP